MLTALITISLLSLLVATEAEPAGSSVEPTGEPPLRPNGKTCGTKDGGSDQLAA